MLSLSLKLLKIHKAKKLWSNQIIKVGKNFAQ